jgi:hypothetical protein
MKKAILVVSVLFFGAYSHAQQAEKELISITAKAAEKTQDTTDMGWKKTGNFVLLFNQSTFNNDWLGGGTSSIAGNVGLNYDFNYKTEKIVWDNKIMVSYGLTKLKGQETTKTDDRFEFTSLFGRKAGEGYWYYSLFANFKTQMDAGFKKEDFTNDNGTPFDTSDDFADKRDVKISHFFSPAYLQVGPGMLWKKSDNLKVNIAPATSRLILVHSHFTALGPAFGVEQGDTSRFEFGAAVNAYYKFNLMENISMENILNLYSNYLEDPQNVDIDYQMNLVMKINKYISTNLSVQALYDDNATGAFQVKEVFGLGVNYGF